MMQKYSSSYSESLGVASLTNNYSGVRIVSVLMQPGTRRPAVQAYTGIRYSRSSASVLDLVEEVDITGVDADKRLAKYFAGYGHASCADMSQLTLCIENVPMWFDLYAFNINPVISGQVRSTRYQNFGSTENWHNSNSSAFNQLMKMARTFYNEIRQPTEDYLANKYDIDFSNKSEVAALRARTLDCTRYVLPMGFNTSLAIQMSARGWGQFISNLTASHIPSFRQIGEDIKNFLLGKHTHPNYVPESPELIRHIEARDSRIDYGISEMMTEANSIGLREQVEDVVLYKNEQSALLDSLGRNSNSINALVAESDLGNIPELLIPDFINRFKTWGTLAQFGAYNIGTLADIGVVKELNRHRSWKRYIPALHSSFNWNQFMELSVCPYIGSDSDLYGRYVEFYRNYEGLRQTFFLPIEEKIMSTLHAHKIYARLGFDLDSAIYTLQTRTRPGCHIACRVLTEQIGDSVADHNPLLTNLPDVMVDVDINSKSQFVDRS